MKTPKTVNTWKDTEQTRDVLRYLSDLYWTSRRTQSLVGSAARHPALVRHIDSYYQMKMAMEMTFNGINTDTHKRIKEEWLQLRESLALLDTLYRDQEFMTFCMD